FVGVENASEHLPPPKNLNFIWITPFDLSVTWEKPEGLDPTCRVNYTMEVHEQVSHFSASRPHFTGKLCRLCGCYSFPLRLRTSERKNVEGNSTRIKCHALQCLC
ncbi:interleukin 13 receptor, partial [Triplophysa rosa]